ncbi:hypothetical protein V6N13_035560 [Hibiscus sabdariffa]|uniref:Uncharacterized protein n=1 Tax=Hibiscus sabdariffa TaxID=183260 RepID=A0ABR2S9U9_9ROSI
MPNHTHGFRSPTGPAVQFRVFSPGEHSSHVAIYELGHSISDGKHLRVLLVVETTWLASYKDLREASVSSRLSNLGTSSSADFLPRDSIGKG